MNDVVRPGAECHRLQGRGASRPWSVPLDEIDVSNPYLYSEDTCTASSRGCGATIRVCTSCDSPLYGPYWS